MPKIFNYLKACPRKINLIALVFEPGQVEDGECGRAIRLRSRKYTKA
jgi:hypothetical protein